MDSETQSRLEALDQKLKAMDAKKSEPSQFGQAAEKFDGMGLGYRMMIELTVGILIGVGIGMGLDNLFGTAPWFLVVMVFVGLAAGVKVMMQSAARYEAKRLQKLDEEKNDN